jgi:hypothetical protein
MIDCYMHLILVRVNYHTCEFKVVMVQLILIRFQEKEAIGRRPK